MPPIRFYNYNNYLSMKRINYLPQFNSFGIKVEALKTNFSIPLVVFSYTDYLSLGYELPESDAPIVGVIFPKKQDYYLVDADYLKALALTGVKILFLDYEHYPLQIKLCDALMIAGDSIKMPERYYTDAKNGNKDADDQTDAYIKCYKVALKYGKPILGICAGMQIIAAEAGLKLFRSQKYFESPYSHKTDKLKAHHIDLVKGSPFCELMDGQWRLPVNSRHDAALAPIRVQREILNTEKLPLDFYAFATDGIPEAIGKMGKGVLGVQWHPENYVAEGDKTQQHIFEWLAKKAYEYHRKTC